MFVEKRETTNLLQVTIVAIVEMQDILDICESKNVDVYLLDFRFLIMFDSSFIVDVALASESNEISSEYLKFSDVFFENEVRQLSKHESHDYAIKTKKNSSISDFIHNLSLIELKVLKSYIEDNLIKDFITFSVSSSSALILFIKKKNDELRLCVDYKDLNVVIIKNKYLLSLIQKLFDILQKTVRFIKINIRDVFNILRIRVDDEWKTIFRCRYNQYEYRVMLFNLVNASIFFQVFIHEALKDFLNQFVIVYLDDILIFSRNDANHSNHVRLILERLRWWNLHVKLFKCLFNVQELEFLNYILSTREIVMNVNRIVTVFAWSESRNHHEIQIFLEFANFYRRFIEIFSRIAKALTFLLKKENKKRFRERFVFNADAKKAFEILKIAFTSVSMLLHFDLDKRS
jgi:hypothetical protein